MNTTKVSFLFLLITLSLLAGCSTPTNPARDKEGLLQADRDFSKMSADKGMYDAFDYYMADSATHFRANSLPIVGRENIRALMSGETGATLAWEPYQVDVAASGDLGYTLGKWQYVAVDTAGNESISTGHYVSIWKKQPDGTWKYVFDAGTSDPPKEN